MIEDTSYKNNREGALPKSYEELEALGKVCS
jgi:hypothetical protein